MTSWADQIEADLRWRESELGSLKLAVASAPSDTDRQKALLRALLAMLYAHYEGFYKFCWDLLLDEIERVQCTRVDATDPIAELSLHKVFKEMRADVSPKSLWKFVRETFPQAMNDALVFPVRPETNSNLWPNLAIESNRALGLQCDEIEEHKQLISSLVGRRNEIAHGEKLVVRDLAEYENYEKAVMLVLHDLAVAVLDQLDKKSFLKVETPFPYV